MAVFWSTFLALLALQARERRGMESEAAVGRRVRVFWEGEGEWFEGVVVAFSPESGYFVRYDDGEEQWEDAGDKIVFLPSASDGDVVVDVETGEPAMPSPSYSQQEFEDDGGDDAISVKTKVCEEQHPSRSSPCTIDSPSPRDSSRTASDPGRQGQQRPAVATTRALKGGGAAFFRDEDALRETKHVLEAEKRELLRTKVALETQLASRESVSAVIKRELQQLKTQVSLASALHYSSSSSSCSSSSTPKTTIEWKQHALDLRLSNQQLMQDIVGLKTAWQSQQRRVEDQQQRVEQLRAKVGRVPQRELLTLGELQVAIAQLLQRKRELEVSLRTNIKATARTSRQSRVTEDVDRQEARRTALEKQLARLELSLTQSQEDARTWRTRLECERARLQPMRERLVSLRSELLSQAESKRVDGRGVLLRSLFLRIDSDGNGIVDRTAAIEAIGLVLGRSVKGEASTPATGADDSQQLSFDQFIDAYQRLAARSTEQ
jgi:hypothetical protein